MSGHLINSLTLQVLTGLQLGAIYALIALGLTLIFGTLGVVNFAHGALYLVAAYCAVFIANSLGFGWGVVLVPTILFAAGWIMERGLVRHFYTRPHTDQILVTFGLAIVVEEALKWGFGSNNIPYPAPAWGSGIVRLHDYLGFLEGFVVFPKWRLVLIGVSLAVIVALFALLRLTTFGLVIRAGMRDAGMLRFLGVNISQRFALVFGLGALIAGVAGVFGGPITQVSPEVGMHLLVPSFLVVVIGGMGSLEGALIAAMLLGMALSFSAQYSAVQQIIIYLVAVVVLLVRPRGLLGKKGVFE
ncbi:branched-chain amino acid ABC transporter permease [Desulfohalovibrio reitneri]|uniref:branched-chain amino acid ABC transporter permease n=1 Tax=Desulfohalovibrio reitneri TaxID=1307759 RepID=UPI0004A6DAC4|nr:branched-chain amino acid ABC transporter permease [Desulfohalovibrio reitneri]